MGAELFCDEWWTDGRGSDVRTDRQT
jgi:hypothetical protein